MNIPKEAWPATREHGAKAWTVDIERDGQAAKIQVLMARTSYYIKKTTGGGTVDRHTFTWAAYGGPTNAWEAVKKAAGVS